MALTDRRKLATEFHAPLWTASALNFKIPSAMPRRLPQNFAYRSAWNFKFKPAMLRLLAQMDAITTAPFCVKF